MNDSKGDAYKEMGIEPWDVIIENFNPSAVRGYFIGEALAYLMRYNGDGNDRGGVKDLKKAQAFIERLIEYDENCSSSGPVRLGSSPSSIVGGGGSGQMRSQSFVVGAGGGGAKPDESYPKGAGGGGAGLDHTQPIGRPSGFGKSDYAPF